MKQCILKYTGYYKNLELASFCNLSVNINVIINFIHVSVHQSTKMRQNAILCKSKMRKFHAILLFFQNSTTRKVQITLKICSFKSLILHFLPKLQQHHFKTTIRLSKFQVGFKELHKDKLNKHFLLVNFGKTAIFA